MVGCCCSKGYVVTSSKHRTCLAGKGAVRPELATFPSQTFEVTVKEKERFLHSNSQRVSSCRSGKQFLFVMLRRYKGRPSERTPAKKGGETCVCDDF